MVSRRFGKYAFYYNELGKKSWYDEFTLAGMEVEVYLNLLSISTTKQIPLCLSDPFWIVNIRPASREVILKPTCIIVTLSCPQDAMESKHLVQPNQGQVFSS